MNRNRHFSVLISGPLLAFVVSPLHCDQDGVRWVCVTGSDPSLVIHMANRFGIHPLQVCRCCCLLLLLFVVVVVVGVVLEWLIFAVPPRAIGAIAERPSTSKTIFQVEDCLNPRERLKVDAFRATPVKPSKVPAAAYMVPAALSKRAAETKAITAAAAGKMPAAQEAEAPTATTGESTAADGDSGGWPAGAGAGAPAATGPAAAGASTEGSAKPPASATATTASATTEGDQGSESSYAAIDAASSLPSPDGDSSFEKVSAEPPPSDGGGFGEDVSGGQADPAPAAAPPPAEEILHVLLGRISLRNPTLGRPSNFEREQARLPFDLGLGGGGGGTGVRHSFADLLRSSTCGARSCIFGAGAAGLVSSGRFYF